MRDVIREVKRVWWINVDSGQNDESIMGLSLKKGNFLGRHRDPLVNAVCYSSSKGSRNFFGRSVFGDNIDGISRNRWCNTRWTRGSTGNANPFVLLLSGNATVS